MITLLIRMANIDPLYIRNQWRRHLEGSVGNLPILIKKYILTGKKKKSDNWAGVTLQGGLDSFFV